MEQLSLLVLPDKYAMYRFEADSDLPDWIKASEFYSVTKTKDELSVVSRQSDSISESADANQDWRILKIEGPLDLSSTGIIANISGILAERSIPIFTISTYDTDYILVKNHDLNNAIETLKAIGHKTTFEK